MTAGNDIASGLANSLTEAGPRASRSTMSRLVESPSAWNTRSSDPPWLGMSLTIDVVPTKVK